MFAPQTDRTVVGVPIADDSSSAVPTGKVFDISRKSHAAILPDRDRCRLLDRGAPYGEALHRECERPRVRCSDDLRAFVALLDRLRTAGILYENTTRIVRLHAETRPGDGDRIISER